MGTILYMQMFRYQVWSLISGWAWDYFTVGITKHNVLICTLHPYTHWVQCAHMAVFHVVPATPVSSINKSVMGHQTVRWE